MIRKYVSVQLTARVSGDDLVLLDANGKKIGVVPAHAALPMQKPAIADCERRHAWRLCVRQMLACNGKRHLWSRQCEWSKKTQNWLASIRHRRNRPEHSRQACERRARRWIEKRPHWDAALALMLVRNNAVIYKQRARADSPWRVWTETVAANIKSRRRRHEDHEAALQAHEAGSSQQAGGAAIHVRFDWAAFDAANSLA